jgi:hypothetical protein
MEKFRPGDLVVCVDSSNSLSGFHAALVEGAIYKVITVWQHGITVRSWRGAIAYDCLMHRFELAKGLSEVEKFIYNNR